MKSVGAALIILLFCNYLFAENLPKGKMSESEAVEFGKRLTLEQAVAMILRSSTILKMARGRIAASAYGQVSARGEYYPKLSLSATHLDQNRISRTTTFFEPNPYKTYQYGLRADYTLYNGKRRESQFKLAHEKLKSSRFQYASDKRAVVEVVIRTYYDGVALLSQIDQAYEDFEFEKENLVIANKRIEAGVASINEKLNFELRIAQAKSKLLELKTQWKVLISELAALFSVDAKHLSGLEELQFNNLENENLMHVDAIIEKAFRDRSDIALAQSRIREIQLEGKTAKSSYYPELGAFADFTNMSRDSFSTDSRGNAVAFGLQFKMNLFNGFSDKARVMQAKENEKVAKIQLDNTYIQIKAEMESLYLSVLKWRGLRTLDRQSRDIALKKRENMQKEYLAGTQGVLHLNEAQNDLSSAETKYRLSEIKFVLAYELLRNAAVMR